MNVRGGYDDMKTSSRLWKAPRDKIVKFKEPGKIEIKKKTLLNLRHTKKRTKSLNPLESFPGVVGEIRSAKKIVGCVWNPESVGQ